MGCLSWSKGKKTFFSLPIVRLFHSIRAPSSCVDYPRKNTAVIGERKHKQRCDCECVCVCAYTEDRDRDRNIQRQTEY